MTPRIATLATAGSLAALAAVLACAAQQQEAAEPVVRMIETTVTNQTWFDVANCQGQPPAIPARASNEVLVGLLKSANPRIMECMADPKNRGPNERTEITVSTKVPETGVPSHTIASKNITPEGEACIQGVLAKLVPTFIQRPADELKALAEAAAKAKAAKLKAEKEEKAKAEAAAKGKGKGKGKGKEKEKEKEPVVVGGGAEVTVDQDELYDLKDLPPGTAAAQASYVHDVKVQPAVRGNVNEISTYAGQIRLALPSLCSCFEPWKGADPAPFQLEAVLPRPETALADGGVADLPPTVTPTSVTVKTPEGDAATAQVAACVKAEVEKMAFKTPADRQAQVPYNFQFINSSSGKPLGAGEGWAKYQQIEEVSRQREAEADIAVGVRTIAQTLFNQLVAKYQKNDRSVTLKTLVGKCKDLLKADDAWSATLQKRLETEQLRKDVVAALVKEDAKLWGDAEKISTKVMEVVTSDIDKAKKIRQDDEKVCRPVLQAQ